MTTTELTKIWAKISGLFARKTEVATKADKAVVVTLSPDIDQQIVADKTFDEVYALLVAGNEVMFDLGGGYWKAMGFSDTFIVASLAEVEYGEPVLGGLVWNKKSGISFSFVNLQEKLTFDDEPTHGSSNPVKSGGVFTALQGKADVTTLVEVTATGDVTQALDSGKFYRFGEVNSLTLTFTAPSAGMGMWGGKFTASASWSALGIPATIDEAAGNDSIAGGKTYEFNMVDNVIVIKEV